MDAASDGEDMKVDNNIKPQQNVLDIQDGRAQAARFSINLIDIFNSPKPITFGRWNPRELKESEAVKLKQLMIEEELRPFRFESMFNIIIDKRFVDPACISQSVEGGNQNAPMLTLSADGISQLEHFDFAGGRHRMRAMEMVKNERTEKLKKLQEQLRKEKDKADKKNENYDGNEKIKLLEEAVRDEGTYLATIGRWGVMLYDAGA